ncbi:DUF3857 domain-containing transglutaminase family protein [Roseibium sp.]|uniref:DUF3857 domain-containing transglutaminase family protein n=1 Tax=Roseibium sp. TaxID=1936156 RepID=UPI003A971F8D
MYKQIFLRTAVVLAALYAGCFPVRSSEVERAQTPSWVEATKLPDPNPQRFNQIKYGTYWLLSDRQVFWDGETETNYHRRARKIIERQGLEGAASVDIDYDPSQETLTLHHIRILRDSNWTDLSDEVSFELLRREKELENGIVDGELTAHAYLKDVRVGDILDVAYSLASVDPVFEGTFSAAKGMESTVPLGIRRFRVTVPEGMDIGYKAHALDIQPEVTVAGGFKTLSWALTDPDPVPDEEDMPEAYPHWGYVEVSSWKRWHDIVDWLAPHYRPSSHLPVSLREKLDAIAKNFPAPQDRMTEALRLVQDTIRYVGIEIGVGGFIPRQPDEVIAKGYGDCKDKALLLAVMLRYLGIDASAALVHTSTGLEIPDRLPTPYAFDHAIVRASDGDRVFWLDPTMTHQGGRRTEIRQPDYGYALDLDPEAEALQEIPVQKLKGPEIKVSESYSFPQRPDRPVRLDVTSIYTQDEADSLRRRIASKGTASLGRSYLEYYNEKYPGMTPERDLRVVDDLDSNRIRLIEAYTLPQDKFRQKPTLTDFIVRADTILNVLPDPKSYGRTAPVKLPYPGSFVHSIVIREAVKGFRAPKDIDFTNDAFSLRRTTLSSGDTLNVKWQLDILKPQIPAEALEDYLQDINRLNNSSVLYYDFSDLVSELDGGGATGQSEATTMPTEKVIATAAQIITFLAFFAILIFALRYGLKADWAYRENAVFFPVSPIKFLLMTMGSFGLYPMFWMLKFWNWYKRAEMNGIRPAWRMIFGIFWLYPAFSKANARARDAGVSLPPVWGILGAVTFFFVSIFLNSVPVYQDTVGTFAFFAALLLAGISCLPAVIVVNRLNSADPEYLKRNSRYNGWNIFALVLLAINVLVLGFQFQMEYGVSWAGF